MGDNKDLIFGDDSDIYDYIKATPPKYEIKQKEIDFQGALPFVPAEHEVIYVENEYDEEINRFIRKNIDFIRERFKKRGFVFVYLPLLAEDLKNTSTLWRYKYPFTDTESKYDIHPVSSSYILDLTAHQERRPKIRPGFARYSFGSYGTEEFPMDPSEEQYYYNIFEINLEGITDLYDYFDYLIDKASGELFVLGAYVSLNDCYGDAEHNFDYEPEQLLKDVRYKIQLLRRKGISEVVLKELVTLKPELSRLVITKDYRILLPDYKDMEITMEPLVKAVFLLFLRHPEGIAFKCLPDYRDELAVIYENVRLKRKPYKSFGERKCKRSIINVTDPLNNSINEKCTRIKEAFLLKFHESLAENYYITGKCGQPKKIRLPKELIVWEK